MFVARKKSGLSILFLLFALLHEAVRFSEAMIIARTSVSSRISSGRFYHRSSALNLNRFLFDPCEVVHPFDASSSPTVTLAKNDYRTVHAAKTLKLQNGDTIRAGIVGGSSDSPALVTDLAVISWSPEGKIKKAQPTKNGDPPGSLVVSLTSLQKIVDEDDPDRADGHVASSSSRVSLILALPRPLQLARILPMVAQMGVHRLILTSARKVPKDYFGSHLFRKPNELRRHLIEGLCQAGDARIPEVTVVRNLARFLEEDLDVAFPQTDSNCARIISHPSRKDGKEGGVGFRMRDVRFPSEGDDGPPRRILLAVGPEGGWAEDCELDMFREHGFQQVTLGTRILRSDVAVVSLLSLAHDVCAGDGEE